MTASKKVYKPVAAALKEMYARAIELAEDGEISEATVLNAQLGVLVSELRDAFYCDNHSFDGERFHSAVYGEDQVYGVWHGGSSYSSLDFRDEMERWDDIESAKESLRTRYHGADDFVYIDVETGTQDVSRSGWFHTPATNRDSYIDIYPYSREGVHLRIGDQPYKRFFFGPRMGVRQEFV